VNDPRSPATVTPPARPARAAAGGLPPSSTPAVADGDAVGADPVVGEAVIVATGVAVGAGDDADPGATVPVEHAAAPSARATTIAAFDRPTGRRPGAMDAPNLSLLIARSLPPAAGTGRPCT
jgi:hypothetical protein